MAQNIVKINAVDGSSVEFVDKMAGSGAMKDVFFSPDRSYVVAFFREKQDGNARERLENIVGRYRDDIFSQEGGEYWKDLFCWPTNIVEHKGYLGLTAPTYHNEYFFEHGSVNSDMLEIKGQEKNGKWFTTASHRKKFLDPRELGDWSSYLRICIRIARAVRRMHAAGLAHSDLSCNNILVNPVGGNAIIVDIDGLVVPDKYPPDVLGTPGFIAPEVMGTTHLAKDDPKRVLPSRYTDLHALAVMIYMYLLYRHPLEGGKIHDIDPKKDVELGMGSAALFVEHPEDASNCPNLENARPGSLPWADVKAIPYTVTGPYLTEMFNRAFITGLHDPMKRPSANEWEQALVKTVDLIQPCQNASCIQKWYVFDNSTAPKCPFCGTPYTGMLPVLNLYSARGGENFRPDNHRLMVYHNQYIYPWHINRQIFPNEKLAPHLKRPVGYFQMHQGRWILVNQQIPDLTDVTDADKENHKAIPVGKFLELKDGQKILLSKEDGGRLIVVQMVGK